MKYKLSKFDNVYTPLEGALYLKDFIPENKIIWECCYGRGHLAEHLRGFGHTVVGNSTMDFFIDEPKKWDIIITNPPFSHHKDFIEKAITFNKPFAFLIRLEHLGGVRAYNLFKDLDFQIIIPEKRINYLTPKILGGKKTGGATFHSIWLTYRFNLPQTIVYKSLKEQK